MIVPTDKGNVDHKTLKSGSMLRTIHGFTDFSLLAVKEGSFENDNEKTAWFEAYLNGELVHRSAHVHLKSALPAGTAQGNL